MDFTATNDERRRAVRMRPDLKTLAGDSLRHFHELATSGAKDHYVGRTRSFIRSRDRDGIFT